LIEGDKGEQTFRRRGTKSLDLPGTKLLIEGNKHLDKWDKHFNRGEQKFRRRGNKILDTREQTF
jgi:hypothetical protein